MRQCDANLPRFCLCARQCRVDDDSDVSASAQRIPALLRRASALDCRHVRGPFPVVRGSQRAHATGRVAALRAELVRRGLTVAWYRAPTAIRTNTCRRPRSASPGSPASPARPVARRAGRARGAVRRWPLHVAGDADRQGGLCHRASGRHRPINGSSKTPAAAKLGYDPWLHTAEGRRAALESLRRRRRNWYLSTTIRSTRSGPTGRRRRAR